MDLCNCTCKNAYFDKRYGIGKRPTYWKKNWEHNTLVLLCVCGVPVGGQKEMNFNVQKDPVVHR
jgi:hypothetical protein